MENPPQIEDQTDTFSHFDFADLTQADSYKLLVSVVMPRPIAWVVSRDEAGVINAAPFSFFNIVSTDPPLSLSVSLPPPTVRTKTLSTTFASAAS